MKQVCFNTWVYLSKFNKWPVSIKRKDEVKQIPPKFGAYSATKSMLWTVRREPSWVRILISSPNIKPCVRFPRSSAGFAGFPERAHPSFGSLPLMFTSWSSSMFSGRTLFLHRTKLWRGGRMNQVKSEPPKAQQKWADMSATELPMATEFLSLFCRVAYRINLIFIVTLSFKSCH